MDKSSGRGGGGWKRRFPRDSILGGGGGGGGCPMTMGSHAGTYSCQIDRALHGALIV